MPDRFAISLSTMVKVAHRSPVAYDPFDDSLIGEYLRIAILGTASCSIVFWTTRINSNPATFAMVLGNLLVVASLVSARLAALPRLMLLWIGAGCVVSINGKSIASDGWLSPVPFFSPGALLACLVMVMMRDVMVLAKHYRARHGETGGEGLSVRVIGGLVIVVFLALYMVVIPSISVFLEQFRERPTSYTIEELTFFESLRIRSAKFAVFAFFTFFGACVGSFLNVVASSVPKGESIVLRSSGCPKCGVLIRRIDNLPIFSYLNLRGKCRHCGVAIPIRYLFVELIAAAIVASLFLFELITGAANVPEFNRYHFSGILWIIMYTKWDVMGLFFYHVALMNCLLTLALIERDRLPCPRWFGWLLVTVFATLPVAINTLQPVAFDSQVPFKVSDQLPVWLVHLLTAVVGGSAGFLLGKVFRRLRLGGNGELLPLGMALVGIALGWQAMLTIGLFLATTIGLAFFLTRRAIVPKKSIPSVGATALLLVAAMVHQPFWKWLAEYW